MRYVLDKINDFEGKNVIWACKQDKVNINKGKSNHHHKSQHMCYISKENGVIYLIYSRKVNVSQRFYI